MRKNPHVRIRGGLGSVTALVYPTVDQAAALAGLLASD